MFLLEILANAIQYQYEGNTMLMYSILRQKDVFYRIRDLTVPSSSAVNENGNQADIANDGNAVTEESRTADADASMPNGSSSSSTAMNGDTVNGGNAMNGEHHEERGEWVPTKEWLATVKGKMPFQAIFCMCEFLSQRVEELCKRDDVIDQDAVLKFLKQTTMVGILPVPHPIVIRTYQASEYTSMWFTSYMWGVIFTRSQRMPLYDWRKIRLVVINQ